MYIFKTLMSCRCWFFASVHRRVTRYTACIQETCWKRCEVKVHLLCCSFSLALHSLILFYSVVFIIQYNPRSKLCCCTLCLHVAGVLQVSGMRIYTSGDVEAVNGTDVRLRCTFQTSAPINADAVMISWTFRPLKPGREDSVSLHMPVQ